MKTAPRRFSWPILPPVWRRLVPLARYLQLRRHRSRLLPHHTDGGGRPSDTGFKVARRYIVGVAPLADDERDTMRDRSSTRLSKLTPGARRPKDRYGDASVRDAETCSTRATRTGSIESGIVCRCSRRGCPGKQSRHPRLVSLLSSRSSSGQHQLVVDDVLASCPARWQRRRRRRAAGRCRRWSDLLGADASSGTTGGKDTLARDISVLMMSSVQQGGGRGTPRRCRASQVDRNVCPGSACSRAEDCCLDAALWQLLGHDPLPSADSRLLRYRTGEASRSPKRGDARYLPVGAGPRHR